MGKLLLFYFIINQPTIHAAAGYVDVVSALSLPLLNVYIFSFNAHVGGMIIQDEGDN
jgi:hypothetical protein